MVETVRLRDGTEALIWPLLPTDREALSEQYEHLSADSRFHAVLCDVMMPDLGGKDLYEAIQQAGSGLERRFLLRRRRQRG